MITQDKTVWEEGGGEGGRTSLILVLAGIILKIENNSFYTNDLENSFYRMS